MKIKVDRVYQTLKSPTKVIHAIAYFIRFGKQAAIRRAIKTKWSDSIPQGIYWINDDPNDSKRLEMGEYGSNEWKVKRAYHSLLSGYAADRMHFDRTFKYLPSMLLLIPFIQYTFEWAIVNQSDVYGMVSTIWSSIALFIMISPFLASSFLWRFILPRRLVTAEEEKASLDIVERCLVRVPAHSKVPKDLDDKFRVGDIDKDGDSVVGQIVASDM